MRRSRSLGNRHDDGQEAQHAADALEDAVDDEAVQRGVHARRGEPAVRRGLERLDAGCQQILQPGADDAEGEIEHQRHDADEDGQRGVFPGEDAVDALAALVLAALFRLADAALAHALDE